MLWRTDLHDLVLWCHQVLPLRLGEGKSVEEFEADRQLQILGGPSIRS